MKSHLKDLQKRGYASKEEIQACRNSTQELLISMLKDRDPVQRTIAASSLSPLNPQSLTLLLQQLSIEKALYTRLAICETLQKGNQETALKMCSYLGKIGKNQYQTLPQQSSKKKSYPLPRDIIARTLGRMDSSCFPALLKVLKEGNISQIREVLDAIGYMISMQPDLATLVHLQTIQESVLLCQSDALIQWKWFTCLSAFPLPYAMNLLETAFATEGIIAQETQRSMALIKNKLV